MKMMISQKRSSRATAAPGGRARPGLFKRITAIVLMTLLTGVAALALSSPAKAAEDLPNYSFYNLSSSLAGFFSNTKSPDADAKALNGDVWGSVVNDPGSAGSMLGYLDTKVSNVIEYMASQISGSSSAMGYNSLINSTQSSDGNGTATPGMLDYAHFGATLNAMGLDSMSTGLSLNFLPLVGGSLMMLLYILTGAVDLVFTGMIATLSALNPFKLFYVGVNAISPKFAQGMVGGEAAPTFLGGLSSWIGTWYKVLTGMSWTVLVPLFIAVLLLSLLLRKQMDRGSAIRKLLIRIVFIGVGLPLMGSMYTGALNGMGDATKNGSAGSTQVVLSTYVDFQNWAMKNRLSVPEKGVVEWDATGHKPTDKAVANVRTTALEINKSVNPNWSGINSTLNVEAGKSWASAAMKPESGAAAGGLNGYLATIDLLARYMGGAKVEAASFETAAKGDISTSLPYNLPGTDGKKKVDGWFTDFKDPRKGLPAINNADVVKNNPVLRVADGSGLKASPAGVATGVKKFTSPTQDGCYEWVSDSMGGPRYCNMSPLSLYNYLNTSFGSDSMTMYSSAKATSGATREMHNAVTQVGTGTMSGLYWLNAIVLLASFVVIGFGYAFSMVFSNVKRSFQLVTAIPFATLGALPGIGKVVIYSAAMILEIIVTLFIYRFIQVFLLSIPQIVEIPFSTALNAASAGGDTTTATLMFGGTLSMVMTVLSIIGLVVFTVLALRTRGSLVKAINEAVTKLVDKFMETNVAPPGGGGLMPALAGGMASGAGMAAANKVMGGKPTGGKKVAGSGNGPTPVTTGNVPPSGGPGGPQASGPAGALPAGGGGGTGAFGPGGPNDPPNDPPGPSGTGGGPNGPGGNGGNDNPGSPLALGPGPSADGSGGISGAGSSDQSTAKAVAAQGGLSEPGQQGGGGITNSMAAPVGPSAASQGTKDPAAATSSGARAAVKGAEAAGRGAAGDLGGAAAAGISAAGHARTAQKRSGTPSQGTGSRQAPASQPRQAPKMGATPVATPPKPVQKPASSVKPAQKPVVRPNPAPKPAAPAAPVKTAPAPRVAPAPRALPSQGPATRPTAAPKRAPRPVRKDRDA